LERRFRLGAQPLGSTAPRKCSGPGAGPKPEEALAPPHLTRDREAEAAAAAPVSANISPESWWRFPLAYKGSARVGPCWRVFPPRGPPKVSKSLERLGTAPPPLWAHPVCSKARLVRSGARTEMWRIAAGGSPRANLVGAPRWTPPAVSVKEISRAPPRKNILSQGWSPPPCPRAGHTSSKRFSRFCG